MWISITNFQWFRKNTLQVQKKAFFFNYRKCAKLRKRRLSHGPRQPEKDCNKRAAQGDVLGLPDICAGLKKTFLLIIILTAK